jgi:hypothetical protein
MADTILNVLGLISGLVLGILPLSLPLREVQNAPQSIVRVAIGLSDGPFNNSKLKGDTPGITVWNENGERLGSVKPSSNKVEAGSFVDITVSQSSNQQPTYMRVEGGSDSICVAYLGHSWPDGTKRGWLGDMGKLCNIQWYYSSVYVTEANGSQYTVRGA